MTVYGHETEPELAEQLQHAWREGYGCACSDMGDLLRADMSAMGELANGTRSTRARRYFDGWLDAMLEQFLMVKGLEEGGKEGEPCERD